MCDIFEFFLSQKTRQESEIDGVEIPNSETSLEKFKKVDLNNNVKITTGQTLYVPVYSHIYHQNPNRGIDLANTLSIRNTDLDNPIIIKSVNYFNSDGQLVTSYLEQPIELSPLTSIDFVVPRSQTQAGASANFIVEWVAQNQVSNPVVEAVMISTISTQGLSWVSEGRVIKTFQ